MLYNIFYHRFFWLKKNKGVTLHTISKIEYCVYQSLNECSEGKSLKNQSRIV